MGKILKDTTVHQREVAVTFSAAELRELLVCEARKIAGVAGGQFTLKIVQEKEGSPSYSVDRWNARVDIVSRLDGVE